MAFSWFYNESDKSREHLISGFTLYAFCQVLCGLATLIVFVVWMALYGAFNFGILGCGFVLLGFGYEFYCVYLIFKARQYADLMDEAKARGVDVDNLPREFEPYELGIK